MFSLLCGVALALTLVSCASSSDPTVAELNDRISSLQKDLAASQEETRDLESQLAAALSTTTTTASEASTAPSLESAASCADYLQLASRLVTGAFDRLDEAASEVATQYPAATFAEAAALREAKYIELEAMNLQETSKTLADLDGPSSVANLRSDLFVAVDRAIQAAAGANLAKQPQTIGGEANMLYVPMPQSEREAAAASFDEAWTEVDRLVRVVEQTCRD